MLTQTNKLDLGQLIFESTDQVVNSAVGDISVEPLKIFPIHNIGNSPTYVKRYTEKAKFVSDQVRSLDTNPTFVERNKRSSVIDGKKCPQVFDKFETNVDEKSLATFVQAQFIEHMHGVGDTVTEKLLEGIYHTPNTVLASKNSEKRAGEFTGLQEIKVVVDATEEGLTGQAMDNLILAMRSKKHGGKAFQTTQPGKILFFAPTFVIDQLRVDCKNLNVPNSYFSEEYIFPSYRKVSLIEVCDSFDDPKFFWESENVVLCPILTSDAMEFFYNPYIAKYGDKSRPVPTLGLVSPTTMLGSLETHIDCLQDKNHQLQLATYLNIGTIRAFPEQIGFIRVDITKISKGKSIYLPQLAQVRDLIPPITIPPRPSNADSKKGGK